MNNQKIQNIFLKLFFAAELDCIHSQKGLKIGKKNSFTLKQKF